MWQAQNPGEPSEFQLEAAQSCREVAQNQPRGSKIPAGDPHAAPGRPLHEPKRRKRLVKRLGFGAIAAQASMSWFLPAAVAAGEEKKLGG